MICLRIHVKALDLQLSQGLTKLFLSNIEANGQNIILHSTG